MSRNLKLLAHRGLDWPDAFWAASFTAPHQSKTP